MAIKIHCLSEQVKGLLSTLGCTSTVNGDLCSDYFVIAEDVETGNDLCVSLSEERANLPRSEWGYSLHVVNDISGANCQIYHDNGNTGTPEEIILAMLRDVLAAELPGMMIPSRLPTNAEWDTLMAAVGESNELVHWKDMHFWCQDISPDWALAHVVRGYYSARSWNSITASTQLVSVGFRPVFEDLSTDALLSDGALVTVGTLYMNGDPIRVPTRPTWDGDVSDYIPGAKLEFRPALDDPAYQVQAIKIGDIIVADRCLLKNISWDDLAAQGSCPEF